MPAGRGRDGQQRQEVHQERVNNIPATRDGVKKNPNNPTRPPGPLRARISGCFWHIGVRGCGQVRQREPRGPGTAIPCPARGHCEQKVFALGLGFFGFVSALRFIFFRPGCFSHRLGPCGKCAGCGAGQLRERRWAREPPGAGLFPPPLPPPRHGKAPRELGVRWAGGALPRSAPVAPLGDNLSDSVKAAHGPGGSSGRIPSSVFQRPWMR